MAEQADARVAQPRMLALARESRSMTQGQMATAMTDLAGPDRKVSQGYVSRAEAGRLPVAGKRLELYARALGYPAGLLCLSEHEVGAGPGLVHHRRKQAVSAVDLRRIHAVLNLTRIQLRALLRGAPRPGAKTIPHIPADDYDTPEDAARRLRAEWGLPGGPLDSVMAILEDAGGLVACRELVPPVPLDSGAESVPVDAVSGCLPGEDPVVLLNVGTPADRQRFTLAHELGHMVMHPVPHPDQEKQANRFAAELLMPSRQIRAHLQGNVGLPLLAELKARWKVSMWALLRRSRTLGVISDWQYRTLAVEMSSLGYRTREPGELEPESPAAVAWLVNWHLRNGRRVESLAEAAFLRPDEFVRLYLSRPPVLGTRLDQPASMGDPADPAPPAAASITRNRPGGGAAT
jgi:Zn-dependent peptidase ImmA (M78 family)/transcriptional regulator with XRE-family HTH domain